MTVIEKPVYTHDCEKCVFIATIALGANELDGYVCTGRDRSVILRQSSRGPDYWSAPASMLDQITGPAASWGDKGVTHYVRSGYTLLAQWVYAEAVRRGHITQGA